MIRHSHPEMIDINRVMNECEIKVPVYLSAHI